MKKFLSIFMVIVMITSLTVVNAAADTLGDRIANQVFALDAKDKTMFVELVQLFSDVDNKEALADAYEAAFESLAPGQQQRVSSFGGTIAAVSGFATFLAGEADDQAIDNMAQYLNQNDKDAFIAAINRRENDFRAAVGGDIDAVERGIQNLPKLFSFLSASKVMNTAIFIYNTATGQMSLDEDRAEDVIDVANGILENDIEDVDSVIDAMQGMPAYYNNASSNDKNLARAYLTKYGFIQFYTPTENGDDDDDDDYTGGPSGGTPVITPAAPSPTPAVVGSSQKPAVTQEVKVTVKDGVATGSYTQDDWKKIEGNVKEGEAVVISATTTKGDAQEAAVAIDMSAINKMEEVKVDSIVVKTDVGSVEFKPSVLKSVIADKNSGKENETITSVNLSLSAKTADEAFPNGMTEKQKEVYKEGSPIFNISLEYTKKVGNEIVTEKLTSDNVFDKPVVVTLPYTLKEGDDPDSIVVYYIDADGNLQNVGGVYDPVTKTVRCSLLHFSLYMIGSFDKDFPDLDKTHWAYSYIKKLTANEVINGMPDGTFKPEGDVTRAEFAKMTALVMKYIYNEDFEMNYKDVRATDWFYKYASMTTENEVIMGYPNNMFMPNNNITRQEMAVIIARALGDKMQPSLFSEVKFTDKQDIALYARNQVAVISKAGILDWIEGDKFEPTKNTTRAEAATMLYKLMEVMLNLK